ncbi:DUF6928 family protein, partial [Streptomyces sp. NPDC020845]|uniref:DUF6928 family protein n=1 Tax=Streptomyces sp. NPDC020845 TaxID=3365096 RepID=UPI00379370BC
RMIRRSREESDLLRRVPFHPSYGGQFSPVADNFPSRLPEHLIAASAGRRLILHAMHSVVDWFAFAVWCDGRLIRSLSLSPDDGVIENIGDSFPFELPYWSGERPADVVPWPGEEKEPYPLPFHPLDLGEDALRALCGFIQEGCPEPDDVDADGIELHGFRVQDPDGPGPQVGEAALRRAVEPTWCASGAEPGALPTSPRWGLVPRSEICSPAKDRRMGGSLA